MTTKTVQKKKPRVALHEFTKEEIETRLKEVDEDYKDVPPEFAGDPSIFHVLFEIFGNLWE
jgi:hypothetical protein